jgi:hypothetical protein
MNIRSLSKEVILKQDEFLYKEFILLNDSLCKIVISSHKEENKSYAIITSKSESAILSCNDINSQFCSLSFMTDSDFLDDRNRLINKLIG